MAFLAVVAQHKRNIEQPGTCVGIRAGGCSAGLGNRVDERGYRGRNRVGGRKADSPQISADRNREVLGDGGLRRQSIADPGRGTRARDIVRDRCGRIRVCCCSAASGAERGETHDR